MAKSKQELNKLMLNDFQRLFSGSMHNYGQHTYATTKQGQKEKGSNKTVKDKLLTIDNYRSHLNGEIGLGVIPINEENKCKFSVIDVDIYNTDLSYT